MRQLTFSDHCSIDLETHITICHACYVILPIILFSFIDTMKILMEVYKNLMYFYLLPVTIASAYPAWFQKAIAYHIEHNRSSDDMHTTTTAQMQTHTTTSAQVDLLYNTLTAELHHTAHIEAVESISTDSEHHKTDSNNIKLLNAISQTATSENMHLPQHEVSKDVHSMYKLIARHLALKGNSAVIDEQSKRSSNLKKDCEQYDKNSELFISCYLGSHKATVLY